MTSAECVFHRSRMAWAKFLIICKSTGIFVLLAPNVLHELGAQVISIGNEPTGFNINDKVVRLAGSSGANPFACIAVGIVCLWGPVHGSANEAGHRYLYFTAISSAI